MLKRNLPAGFVVPAQPVEREAPPSGADWVHEIKHDGYRLQIHVRNGRVRLYTMIGADWSKRYPRIVEEAARLREPLIIDAEVVCLDADGVADFDTLHSRTADEKAVACAFDLLLAGALLFDRCRPIALFQTAHHQRGDKLLFAVIVKLDDDAFFTAGQDGPQSELKMLDLGALGIRVRSHRVPKVYSSDVMLEV